MKPVKLTISAFGPYADRVELDFDDLNGQNFFLIHGQTGAGKTAILDAVCYALYGSASGTEREREGLRSDWALPTVATEVEFEFVMRNKKYRIWRMPPQYKAKKKGSGETYDANNYAELMLMQPEQKLLCKSIKEVDKAVSELIGLSAEQFRQVVLLPQGEFKKMLMASGAERQKLMECLFDTAIYAAMERYMVDYAKKCKDDYQQQRDMLVGLLQGENWSDCEQGRVEVAALKEKNEILKKALLSAEAELCQAQEKHKQAEEWQKRFTEYDLRTAEKEKLKVQAAEIAQKKELLEKAEKARTVIAYEQAFLSAKESSAKRQNDFLILKTETAQCQDILVDVQAAFDAVSLRYAQRDNLLQEIEKAAVLITRSESYQLLDQKIVQHKAKFEETEGQRDKLTNEYQRQQQVLTERENRIKQLETELDSQGEIYSQAEKFQTLAEETKKLPLLRKRATEEEKTLAGITVEFNSQQGLLQERRQIYAKALSQFINGQAGQLAQQLEDSQPCPVCGSLEHPHPAKNEQTESGSKDELELMQKALDKLQTELEGLNLRKEKSSQELQRLMTEQEHLMENLTEKTAVPVDKIAEEAENWQKKKVQSDRYKNELAAQRIARDKLTAESIALDKVIRELTGTAAAIQAEMLAAQEMLEKTAAEFTDRAVLTVEAATVRKHTLEREKDALDKEYKLIEGKLQMAKQHWTAKVTEESVQQQNLQEVMQKAENAQRQYDEELKIAGFDGRESYTKAKKTAQEISTLQAECKQYNDAWHEAEILWIKAEQAVQGLTRPDLPHEREQLASKEKKCQEVRRAFIEQEAVGRKKYDLLTKAKKAEELQNKLEATYQTAANLDQITRGIRGKVSLRRFALGEILRAVLEAANSRLRVMSNGRYCLQRAQGSKDSGLDIEVFDNNTGKGRAVATLSGGESFLASLALALGLSDIVQNNGQAQLDTVFIDEGFGTLDNETLEFALKTLLEIQNSGRLVGIISHVDELKQRIDAKLEVVKRSDGRGSSARFVG